MTWHADVSIGDLHYLRSKFALEHGYDGIYLSSFIKATEAFYQSKQFRVKDNHFLTWAYLLPEWEENYLSGKNDWLFHCNEGNPWIMEAHMPKQSLSAMKQLKNLIGEKTLRFVLKGNGVRELKLP